MRGIHTCCPEAPSVINITQNIIEMDGTRAFWVDQYLLGSGVSSNSITLEYVPYARARVFVMLNTATMRQGFDYSVLGNKITLNFTPASDDLLHINYFALTDGTSTLVNDNSFSTGMTIGFGGAAGTEPEGWLRMDGTTLHLRTSYAGLAAWLDANDSYLNLTLTTGTHFVLKALQTSFFHEGSLIAGPTIIKT